MAITKSTASIPCDSSCDATIPFFREGYRYIGNRCESLRTDLFRTRLMLRKVVCMRGPAASEQFYREGRFTRRGAMPMTALTLLQDRGSVQMLDGGGHRNRKQMFMAMMTSAAVARGREIFRREWRRAKSAWLERPIMLHDSAAQVLTRTGLSWCGLDPDACEPKRRAAEFKAMIVGAGSIGITHLRAQFLRRRSERWARGAIERIRAGDLLVEMDSPAALVAGHCGPDGQPLATAIAAVELINLLRPIVAVARFITFAAVALHDQPGFRADLDPDASEEEIRAFVHEVRRFYPFFPAIGGRVLEPFVWRGHSFRLSDWVLLDLYGTNHDPQAWRDPETFRPQRFLDWKDDAYMFVPQGGGGFLSGHRCPGEWLTIGLASEAVRQLLAMRYDVPEQDLSIPINSFPTLPVSGFVLIARA